MEWKNKLTKTPYLVLFTVLIAISVGTASALITITLAGNVIITDDLTVDTNTFFVDSSENKVGLGTITPSEKLDVKGNVAIDGSLDVSNAPIYSHRNPNTNTANLIIERTGGPTSENVQFTLSHRATNKDLWLYGFNGTTFKNFVGFDYPNYKINFPVNGDALVIDGANDAVGIGTTSPESKLHVVGNVQIDGNLTGSDSINCQNCLIGFYKKEAISMTAFNASGGTGGVSCDVGDFAVGGGAKSSHPETYVRGSEFTLPTNFVVYWSNIIANSTLYFDVICADFPPVHEP